MKLRHLALGLAALALAPASAETLELTNERLFLNVAVNGQRTVALLDSGAEMTIVDDGFAERLGLEAVGSATAHGSGAAAMEARFADHVAIEAVGIAFETRVGILDLGEVSRRLLGRDVTMLLGRDLFDRARLRIDIRGGTIGLAGSVPEGGVRLPVSAHRGIPAIPASIEGEPPVQAAFDLGNGSGVMVGRPYAERIGLAAPERIVERQAGGGLGGERRRDIVVLRSLVLAGREYRDVRAAIDPGETASDLNIGTSILRDFIITTDFAAGAIWLEPREASE